MKMIWAGFTGVNRAAHPRLLNDSQGVESVNQKPGRGDLRPWKAPLAVASASVAGKGSIYRFGRDTKSDTLHWLTFDGAWTFMRGFDAEDPTEITYGLGPQGPKWFDSTMLGLPGQGPAAMRELSVPAPTLAPAATITTAGNAGTEESWSYVYTFVNDKGWESAPSQPSADITVKTGGTVITISGMEAAPAGNYGITQRRIYRAKTGTSGSASYFLLKEISVGASSTTDTGEALSETLPTLGWRPMPDDAHHLTPLWNGMASVLAGKAIRFCEANTIYAWPLAYEIVLDHTAVASAAYQQSLIVATTGQPYLVTGTEPINMSAMKLEFHQSCVAPRSMTSVGHGVVWASPDGLAYTGTLGTRVLTQNLMLREDWQALNPSTMIGAFHDGLYFCLYQGGGFVIDPANPTGLYHFDSAHTAVFVDTVQDALFLLNGTSIQKWDHGAAPMTARAKSKLFTAVNPVSFACVDLIGDGPATVTVHADGVAQSTQTISIGDVMRLPSASTFLSWQLEVQTTGTVQAVRMAQGVRELSGG